MKNPLKLKIFTRQDYEDYEDYYDDTMLKISNLDKELCKDGISKISNIWIDIEKYIGRRMYVNSFQAMTAYLIFFVLSIPVLIFIFVYVNFNTVSVYISCLYCLVARGLFAN